ncbi:hypothetical protein NDA03_23610 [Trichocoleus sp. Lan]|uniref:hypothetical protein n=1 Tax=Trichocoleus sp. Lan TaxID=2933927 RepID=UPI00329898D1
MGQLSLATIFSPLLYKGVEGTVRVETIGDKTIGDDGLETIQPTGKFKIQWLDGTREEGKIPDWLTEELLIGMLPQPQSMPTTIQQTDGSFAHQTDIRQRLEFLLGDTGIDTGIDTGTREKTADTSDTGTDTSIDSADTESDTVDTGSAETIDNTGGSDDTERDTGDTFTPAQLPRTQVLKLADQMKVSGLSQTQIIQALWGCEKNKAGWKQAYAQFKELMGDDQP